MTAHTFEQTYVNYPFAPLVTLVLQLSVLLGAPKGPKNTDAGVPTGMVTSA